MKKIFFILMFVIVSNFSFAQGCSDAGICTINHAFQSDEKESKNSVEIATIFGAGETDEEVRKSGTKSRLCICPKSRLFVIQPAFQYDPSIIQIISKKFIVAYFIPSNDIQQKECTEINIIHSTLGAVFIKKYSPKKPSICFSICVLAFLTYRSALPNLYGKRREPPPLTNFAQRHHGLNRPPWQRICYVLTVLPQI